MGGDAYQARASAGVRYAPQPPRTAAERTQRDRACIWEACIGGDAGEHAHAHDDPWKFKRRTVEIRAATIGSVSNTKCRKQKERWQLAMLMARDWEIIKTFTNLGNSHVSRFLTNLGHT